MIEHSLQTSAHSVSYFINYLADIALILRHYKVSVEVSEPIILSTGDSFAAYSLPHQTNHTLIRGAVKNGPSTKGGFAIQIFDKGNSNARFITPDQVWDDVPFSFCVNEECTLDETTKDAYLQYAQATIDEIKSSVIEKVVMSRVKLHIRTSDSATELYDLFSALKFAYPKAFVFFYFVPDVGCWCGATPEVLLAQTRSGYSTVALAGTQADRDIDLSSVTWGAKEQREQAIIEEYVAEILADEQIRAQVIGPETVRAGAVLHIQTSFEMTELRDPLRLAQRMHPGPAICGVPLVDALTWIKDNEPHHREQYCGYIGPWGITGKSELYINLRSMRIYKDCYALFLGGGLTQDSIAIDEWEETELKSRTLLSVIQQSVLYG